MSPTAENVIERLDAARQKWWLFSLLSTTVLALGGSMALLLVFVAADTYSRLSQSWLWALFLAWTIASAWLVFQVGWRMLRGHRSMEAAARRIELDLPEVGSHLINIVQLAEQASGESPFRAAAVHRAAAAIARLPFERAAARQSRWRRLTTCLQTPRDLAESLLVLAVLFSAAWLCAAKIPNWSSATMRLLAPWQFVPSVGRVEFVKVTPGNASATPGDSLDIIAEIRCPDPGTLVGQCIVAAEGQPELRLPMNGDADQRRFMATVAAVQRPFRYRLEIGDSQTAWYTVEVRHRPTVESASVTYRYPAYTHRRSNTVTLNNLDLEAPQFTVAELDVQLSAAVARAELDSDGQHYPVRLDQDGHRLTASLPLLKDGAYTLLLYDEQGKSDPHPRLNRIAVLPDRPPMVELTHPKRQTMAVANARLPIAVHASDDYGIERLQLEMRIENDATDSEGDQRNDAAEAAKSAGDAAAKAGRTIVLQKWFDLGRGSASVVRNFQLQLAAHAVKPGQTVFLRAVAWDNRAVNDWGLNLGPQEGASDWVAVRIVSDEASVAKRLKEWEDLRAALTRLLEKQIAARVATATAAKMESLVDRSEAQAAIRLQQGDIQNATKELVDRIASTDDADRRRIKQALTGLLLTEMDQAIRQCDQAIKAASLDESKKRGDDLMTTQDSIIAKLRALLNVARRAEAAVLAEMQKRPGGDLPDDAKQKLEAIRDKLDKFLTQQKKVIEASEELAKMPVEDFSKEQEEQLKKLAAAEDDLSKFMQELQTDLSKLPEQDFANPSVAKELVEIQVELKMAEDALTKKAVDIAVPLEQLGYERAEELKTNLEKWLPDTPDREKWSQEESLTDQDKEAPMAELPSELEDMVGELMEEEDALFDEMEDVSSSAADSLDKGAGWDAMDGPISNMSGKGVTGNRLPNTSEIGGRSGEGRQGKSSGEMIADEAVGKGGRNTPSRLTPDPVVEGQIRDHSRQPAGGATGGGKESGRGGEGLEGPAPRNPGQRDAQRLAGRQATLRNKAEAIDLQMQVANYQHTDLKRLIEAMAQVERDVKAGRYQNALRQRNVLVDGLRNVKQHMQGEFQVRKDATPNVPTDVQKKILGSMQDPSPAGWETLNRDYFDRLSGKSPSPDNEPSRSESGKK